MLLAQTTTGQTLEILENAFYLTQNTVDAWSSLWQQAIFDPQNSYFWIGLVTLGLILGTISVLYVAVVDGKTIIEKQDWAELAKMLIWPFVIIIFLSNNGVLLAETVKTIRLIGQTQIQNITEIQIAGLTFQKALEQITISNAAKEQIESVINECSGKQGQELVDCLSKNQSTVEDIINEAEQQNNGSLESLSEFVQNLWNTLTNAGDFFRNTLVPIIRAILAAVQWAFVNILEAALLLDAALAPIAMGLSLLPLQGRPIIAWLISFAALLNIQLCYNIIIGLTAVVIVHSHGELFTDIAFLFFLAIFAPALAVRLSSGGGKALYQGIASGVKTIINVASVAVGKVI